MYELKGNVLKEIKMENVKKIADYKSTKKIKTYVSHLHTISNLVNLSVKGLKFFEVYSPVHEILRVMRDQTRIIEAHLKHYEDILKKREGNE